jgi:hypothetical protein
MGTSPPVILKVLAPEFKKVVVETSNGKRYHSDLSSFSNVYCFPKSDSEWRSVGPDSAGFALVWSSRFEVHVDQIIALATKVEDSSQSA